MKIDPGIWSQSKVPVLVVPLRKQLGVRLPYATDNRGWLQQCGRVKPKWDASKKCWRCPHSWVEKLVRLVLDRFGKCYLLQEVSSTHQCAPACWDAMGVLCECACGGRNHGAGLPQGRQYVLSDTFALVTSETQTSVRLLTQSRN